MRPGLLLLLLAGSVNAAWIQTRSPSFFVLSDASPRATRLTLAQLEQFRFALGSVLGKELSFDPPVDVVISARNDAAMFAQGRERFMLALPADRPVPPEVWKQLAGRLIERNVGRLPEEWERGVEAFFSTLKLEGAKVTWGAPPAPPDRDWARVAYLLTTADYAGRFRVLLFNLQRGLAQDLAWRNAYGKRPQEMEREIEAFWKGGLFGVAQGPSRAISPERDFSIKDVAAERAALLTADLLDTRSAGEYRQMLAAGQHVPEAQEGLGLLALRNGDRAGALGLLRSAFAGGSKNAYALTAYAGIEPDEKQALAALQRAVASSPGDAEPHFLLAERSADPVQREAEYRQAAKLAPQHMRYWARLAEWDVARKNFGDAAKAWTAAEQAATNNADREKMHAARMAIEDQRLDYEEAERERKAAEEKARIDQLKAGALAQLHAAEEKANGGKAPSGYADKAVPWWDGPQPDAKVEGMLLRVDCSGRGVRMVIQSGKRTVTLKISDPAKITLTGTDAVTLPCGEGRPRAVLVEYFARPDRKSGDAGEAASVTFR